MLERIIAFGVVVGFIFALAAWVNDDEQPGPAEALPQESTVDACEGECAPKAPPRVLSFQPPPSERDDDDRDDEDDEDEEKEEKKGKGGKGRKGKD